MLNIVLYEPEIPPNTGNISRLCASNDLNLHLIKPLGFELSDKYLKRSAMDYWQYLKLNIHENWQAYLDSLAQPESTIKTQSIYFLTTKAKKVYWEVNFKENDTLVFGPETRGLPADILNYKPENNLLIPMFGNNYYRSLNLSTCVGIVAYEAIRQIKF